MSPRKRIYRDCPDKWRLKVRLQHRPRDGSESPLLRGLDAAIDRRKLASYRNSRLGTNPRYEGRQTTAVYLEIDARILARVLADGGLTEGRFDE